MDLFLPLLCCQHFFVTTPLHFWQRLSGVLYSTHGCIPPRIKLCLCLGGISGVFWLSHRRVVFVEDLCGITAPSSCHPSARLLPPRAVVWHGVMPQIGCAFRCRVSFGDVAASFRESVLGSIQKISDVNIAHALSRAL